MISIFTLSVTAGQGPLLVDVKVKITLPAVISAAVIVYLVVRLVVETMPPMPELVHAPVEPPPPIVPERPIVGVVEQSDWLTPAFTIAGCRIIIISVSESGKQFPLLVEVKVSVTEPAAISAGPGVYDAVSTLAAGEKVPLPDVVQLPVEAPAVTDPLRAKGLVLQLEPPVPAFTTGDGVMEITRLSVAVGQTPFASVVNVMVTDPAALSAAEGE
jgi:hypothetical protein